MFPNRRGWVFCFFSGYSIMRISQIKNLLESDLNIVWKGNIYYPPSKVTDEDIRTFNEIECLQINLPGAGSISDNYNKVYAYCYQVLKIILERISINAFAVILEDREGIKNRMRSYKGILPKKGLHKDDLIEHEVSLNKQTSLIAGMVRLNRDSYPVILDKINDRRKGFIVQIAHPVFNENFLAEVVDGFRQTYSSFTSIDYFKLLGKFCNAGAIIYRVSGDGDTSLQIDIFFKSEKKEEILAAAEQAVMVNKKSI